MAELKATHVKGQVLLDDPPTLAHHAVRKSESDTAFEGVTAYVDEQVTIVTTAHSALVIRTDTIEASVGDAHARITTVETAYADADTAIASRIDVVEASVGVVSARVTTEVTARATADTALATRVTTVEASIGESNARISTLEEVVITMGDAATVLATRVTTVEASMGTANARITSVETAMVTADEALATRIDTVEASFGADIAAAVTVETNARTTADTALATRVTTVEATMGNNTAAIIEEASARAAADGALEAMWGIAIDINGRIVGRIRLSGDEQSSTFELSVDKVVFTNPSYANNAMPTQIEASGDFGSVFHTNLGTGAGNVFEGLSGVVGRSANVAVLGTLRGVGVGSGFDAGRLRYAGVNAILSQFQAQGRNATVWYRIRNGSTVGNWKVMAAYGWGAPGPTAALSGVDGVAEAGGDPVTGADGLDVPIVENFHTIGGFNMHDIAVGALEELEIGVNGLDGDGNGDTVNDANNDLYHASLKLSVVNL